MKQVKPFVISAIRAYAIIVSICLCVPLWGLFFVMIGLLPPPSPSDVTEILWGSFVFIPLAAFCVVFLWCLPCGLLIGYILGKKLGWTAYQL